MRYRSTSFTHRGGTRKHNEDALLDASNAGVWMVADGMGGYQAGDVASQLACDTVAQEISSAKDGPSVSDLENALNAANARIRRYSTEALGGQVLGSTVVALLMRDNRYHLFWAGDSRCYRIRDGALAQLSRDHSQVTEMVEQGLLQPDEAERHPLAHVITRALGVDDQLRFDYRTGDLQEGDTFLLCSDGVSKQFSSVELAGFLQGGQIDDAGLAIMHSALVRECNDNITCIIVNIMNDCYSSDSFEYTDDETVRVRKR